MTACKNESDQSNSTACYVYQLPSRAAKQQDNCTARTKACQLCVKPGYLPGLSLPMEIARLCNQGHFLHPV